jgi:hypothetical protein
LLENPLLAVALWLVNESPETIRATDNRAIGSFLIEESYKRICANLETIYKCIGKGVALFIKR